MSSIFCLLAQTLGAAFPSSLILLILQCPNQTLSTQVESFMLLFWQYCTILLPLVLPRYLMNLHFHWRLDLPFWILEGRNHILFTFFTYFLSVSPSGSPHPSSRSNLYALTLSELQTHKLFFCPYPCHIQSHHGAFAFCLGCSYFSSLPKLFPTCLSYSIPETFQDLPK